MSTPAIDYDALAQQNGGTAVVHTGTTASGKPAPYYAQGQVNLPNDGQVSSAVDYDALAAQHGGSAASSDQKNPVVSWRDSVDQQLNAPPQDTGWRGFIEQHGQNIAKNVLAPVLHPEQTINSMADMATEPWKPAIALGNQIKNDYQQGGIGQVAGNLADQGIGAALQGGVIAGIPGAVGEIGDAASGAKNYLRPTPSPAIVPPAEMAARQLSAAVLPATKDAANFIQAAQQEVPNIIDYAKRTGNPLNTQLEFSKAAQGYAQEVRNFYDQQVLGPNKSTLVKTTGTGFGSSMGDGPETYATLGEIDKRIVNLNKQLDAPTLNADDARRALATKTELQQEAAGLRAILHQNLSEATGLSPEDIADIRQRVGRSSELANDTNAAVTQRMQNAGKTEIGQTPPLRVSQLPTAAYRFVQGGPVPVADRAFQRAIANFPGEATPLPSVVPTGLPSSSARMNQLLQLARQRQQAIIAASQKP